MNGNRLKSEFDWNQMGYIRISYLAAPLLLSIKDQPSKQGFVFFFFKRVRYVRKGVGLSFVCAAFEMPEVEMQICRMERIAQARRGVWSSTWLPHGARGQDDSQRRSRKVIGATRASVCLSL